MHVQTETEKERGFLSKTISRIPWSNFCHEIRKKLIKEKLLRNVKIQKKKDAYVDVDRKRERLPL